MIANTLQTDPIVEEYIRDVTHGYHPFCEAVGNAVAWHVRDLEEAEERGFYFSPRHALEAIAAMEQCPHTKGRWKGAKLSLSPWQRFIIWCLFGWREAGTDLRRFRKAYICVARKNGKSTLCAALALLLFLWDEPRENGPEVYTIATKRDQAAIVFNTAMAMRYYSEEIISRTKEYTHPQRCTMHADPEAVMKPLGSEGKSLDGLNASGFIIDELHEWQQHHRSAFEKVHTGGGSREQPLAVMITTAGDDRSILWKQEHDFATRIAERGAAGEPISDTQFSFVAQLDDGDDPFDEVNWFKANPNLGHSLRLKYLREQAREAEEKLQSQLVSEVSLQYRGNQF